MRYNKNNNTFTLYMDLEIFTKLLSLVEIPLLSAIFLKEVEISSRTISLIC